jgi:hypothetical protein
MILSLYKFFDVQNWAVMNENKSQQSEQIKLSDQEIEHALALRKNPILANNLGVIIKRFDEEIAQGMDANQAELNAIESVQQFGKAMIEQWAQTTQADIVRETTENSNLIKNGKKNSTGIPPLEQ